MKTRSLTLLGSLGAVILVALGACDEPEVPTGPPRCEPEPEHELDRRLKLGFKALALGDSDAAEAAFTALLVDEPNHPEAQLGRRLADGGKESLMPRPSPGATLPGARSPKPGFSTGSIAGSKSIALGGARIPVDLSVDSERWRFEELRELAPLRHKRDGAGPAFSYFRQRPVDGVVVATEVPVGLDGTRTPTPSGGLDALVQGIDLIVLHDTHTVTARESVIAMEGSGGSTHFVIDWDGLVYQTLDLAWEANHSQISGVDARSVSIDIVNPVELGPSPGLPQAAEELGQHRPLSEPIQVQGDESQKWGYTQAQITSLEALVRALGRILPSVPMKVPQDSATRVPRKVLGRDVVGAFAGVLGHLHVSPRAFDPGPGFDWETFANALVAPGSPLP